MAIPRVEPLILMDDPIAVEVCQPEGSPPCLDIGSACLRRDEVERLRDVLTEWLGR